MATLMVFLLPGQAALALGGIGPFQAIMQRDVFRLRPPTVQVPKPPPPPRAKVRLVGITGLLGHEVALLEVQVAAKGSEPAKQFSAVLGEGQKQQGVEVLHINPRTHLVQVDSYGTTLALTFEPEKPRSPSRVMPVMLRRPTLASAKFWHRPGFAWPRRY